VEAFYTPTMALMIGLSTLLTIYLGGLQAIKDPSQIGTIVEFVIYINMLTFPVSAIGWTASMIQRAAASQKRLNEFLSIEPTIQNNGTQKIVQIKGDIQFKNVDFIYPHSGIKALNNFTLNIQAGQKVLILGKTGSGKSSIAQVLNRMYHVNSGEVSVDGQPIELIDTLSLRKRIGYVQQDVFLFSDSIKNNIQFGVLSSDETIKAAAKSAHILNEIEQLPAGFETMVGERGTTLSGGQKQRISIARALIKEPDLFIFDDCLSAVDANTEKTILANLSRLMQNKTALFITHRIFFNFHFDLIIYIKDGHIAESGTHESLLAKQGLYAELYQTQLSQNQE
jgi:ATP-binding cassette subfamily B protein